MADLTLNFADASFNDPNADNDFIIQPGNDIIYEMGSGTPGNRSDTGITTGASITGAAFTLGHNQEFMFEFEDDGDANTTDDYKLTVMTQTAAGTSSTPAQYANDTVTWDVAQTDFDGETGPDTYLSKTLVDGLSAKVTETRLDNPDISGDQSDIDVYYVGDGEQTGYTSWVLSGDMNGTSGNDTSGDGTLGFHAGTYGGVFLGGTGNDTLVFEHNNEDDTAQMYVGLDAGFAMFGNGANSPLVQFANIGAQPYVLTWERLEMRGDSNDFVVVGGGLQGADSSAAARELDTTDFFEIDLGSGTDKLFVTDSTQSITLDLSKTGEHTVTANSTGSAFTLDVSGNEMYSGQMGDGMSLSVKGTLDDASGNPMDGVIDYIDFGDGQDNAVINNSDQGLAVNFGTAAPVTSGSGTSDTGTHSSGMSGMGTSGSGTSGTSTYSSGMSSMGTSGSGTGGTGAAGGDYFQGSSLTESDLIDLRGINGKLDIDDQDADASGSMIEIDVAGNSAYDITAKNVDLLYVSQLTSGVANASDSDVLVNAEDLYGDTGVLGQVVHDVDGAGYDVITSARMESWSTDGVKQIYYDGDHSDFLDTADILDRNASNYTVAMESVSTTSEQLNWNDQIETAQAAASNPDGNATPSFYIIDNYSGKKVPVYLDETDPAAPQWKVDTSEFEVTSDASGSNPFVGTNSNGDLEAIADKIAEAHGFTVTIDALKDAQAVYLNGSHDDISSLLDLSDGSTLSTMESDAAYDFGFYTQVEGTKALSGGGTETVMINVALDHSYDTMMSADSWTLASDPNVHVQTSYNTVETSQNAAVGGTGGDFVEMGGGTDNVAMGNAGNDAYIVGNSDTGLVNELGDLMGGSLSTADSVQFELVNDMAELDFSRIQIAGEMAGSTLQITADGSKGGATLFDQYNEFLAFRKTEYLVIDDGATSNEVFELVTGDATDTTSASYNAWENEVYVANAGGDSLKVDAGGIDHVYLATGADSGVDTINVVGTRSVGDKVTIHDFGSGDKLEIDGVSQTIADATVRIEIDHTGISEFTI